MKLINVSSYDSSMDRRRFLVTGAKVSLGVVAGSLVATATSMAQAPSNHRREEASTPSSSSKDQKRRIFITGSADGLGHAAARTLLAGGYQVVVHVRSQARLSAVQELVEQGAIATIGDLSDLAQTRDVADQVNNIGRMDAVIHNAGVVSGPPVLPVNVVAPYLLTALIRRPKRLIYLSSSMHTGGRASLSGLDWTGRTSTGSYSDSRAFRDDSLRGGGAPLAGRFQQRGRPGVGADQNGRSECARRPATGASDARVARYEQ